jgi:hypothetical protein
MRRFSSLKLAPAEARRILRDHFARYLRAQHGEMVVPTKGDLVSDELLLHFLLNLEIVFESDVERAKAAYAAAVPPGSAEPSFDEVIAAGWFRVVWGRIRTPFEVANAARNRRPAAMTALTTIFKKRFDESFVLSDAARESPELATVVAEIDGGKLTPWNLRSQDTRWVAARLWDRSLSESGDHSAELRLWLDRWYLLGAPRLVPTQAWDDEAALAFLQTALTALESEPSLVSWRETRDGFAKQLALGSGQTPGSMERHVPPVPDTLVDRVQWLDDFRIERAVLGTLNSFDSVFGLVRLLLSEVLHQANAFLPRHWIAERLLALALEHAELLVMILFQVRLHPVLFADLVLYPATSALACLLVAQWRSNQGGAWDRELGAGQDETTKAFAFADAVSVMGQFLEDGSLAPREAASLLNALHKAAKPVEERGSSDALLEILRGELVGQSQAIQKAIFEELASSMPQAGLGTQTFAAALDVLTAGELSEIIDPRPLLGAYVTSVAAGGYSLTASRIGIRAAASLVEVAMKAPPDLRQDFFAPIDMKARVAAASASDANSYTVNDDTARAIRAHVRILCRALAGLMESAPTELVDGLINAVRAGAIAHAEKGRVGAFGARYETNPYRGLYDRPIAADLGAALGAPVGAAQGKLLAAILEIDEPMVLAQLLNFAPHALYGAIKDRIAALTPAEAGEVLSLPEAQARIDALLSAGLADAASKYIDAERDLKTWGKVPGREVTRLRADLALKLLRGDWAGIAATKALSDLTMDADAAADTIRLYNALAAIHDPAGDREGAVQAFTWLQTRHPQVTGYTINRFAAQITLLVGSNLFGQLHGEALVRGRQILAEAEQAMIRSRTVSASDSETFAANKALLLLALRQPDQAYAIVSELPPIRLGDRIAAYSAIALARMGRISEALRVLDQAEKDLGESSILKAARAHIESGERYAAIASVTSEDDPVPRIKEAFWDFLQLNPERQAEVSADSFESLVIKHVRSTAESVTSLVPMMESIKIDSEEDDLNALVGKMLSARLEALGWSVPDQSKGGFTAKGNPGERDLLVQKSGVTLAIIEAVVCRRPLTHKTMRDDLTYHFQKLLGYGQCNLFVHLTYSYLSNPAAVLDYLKETAKKDAPAGFTFSGSEEIHRTDSQPAGFISRYTAALGPVTVVFLVLDMEQRPQRDAAKAAAETKS